MSKKASGCFWLFVFQVMTQGSTSTGFIDRSRVHIINIHRYKAISRACEYRAWILTHTLDTPCVLLSCGGMAEWLKAAVLKTADQHEGKALLVLPHIECS